MKPNGKEADMSATVTPISSHPSFKPATPDLIEEFWKGSAVMAGGNAKPAPPVTPPPALPMPKEKRVYLSCAETAKLIRVALKKAFPGIKFRVRSNTYSGGASIDVDWAPGGPDRTDVEKVVGVFAGAGFDGMIDLKYHVDHWLLPDGSVILARNSGTTGSLGTVPPESNPKPHPDAKLVSFGADFVFCSRRSA